MDGKSGRLPVLLALSVDTLLTMLGSEVYDWAFKIDNFGLVLSDSVLVDPKDVDIAGTRSPPAGVELAAAAAAAPALFKGGNSNSSLFRVVESMLLVVESGAETKGWAGTETGGPCVTGDMVVTTGVALTRDICSGNSESRPIEKTCGTEEGPGTG